MKRWIIPFVLLMTTSTAWAGDHDAEPGRVHIEDLEAFGSEDVNVWVDLSGPMLRVASRAIAKEDPELSALTAGLTSVRVRVIEDLDPAISRQLRKSSSKSMGKLERKGWQPIVRVNEDDESVFIYTLTDGDNIVGIVVLALESDEATFVNVSGRIRPEDMDRIWELPMLDAAGIRSPQKDQE